MKGPGREQVAPSLLAAASIFLVAIAIVVDGAAYATAAAEPKAEVNGGRGQRVRFGERTASITRLSDGYSQGGGGAEMEEAPPISSPRRNLRGPTPRPLPTSNIDSADISLEAPAKEPRISRRYDSRKTSPPAAQLVDEIPIVQKSRASSNAAGSQTRGQTRSRDELRHRAPQTPSYFSPPSDSASSISASSEQQSSSSSSSLEHGAMQQQYQSRNSNSNRSRSPPPSRSISSSPSSSSPSSSSSSSLQPSDRDFVASRVVGSSSSSSHRSGAVAKTKTAAITAAATTTTTTTTSSTTTARPFFPRNFSLANAFDWLPQNLFNFSGAPAPTSTTTTPTASATKKPPKKYKPSPTPTATHNEVKPNYPKAQLPPKGAKDDVGPFRIALPTINFFNPPTAAASTKEATSSSASKQDKGKRATAQPLRERFNCPRESEVRFQLFPKICKTDKDCSIWNRDELCCEIFGAKSCVSGMPKPLEESSHMPILGLIPRKCPTRPLAELWWDVQECETDNDCWPRVCCPDGRRRYCRTSQPELEVVPVPVKRSFNYLSEYLECTPPPPRIFDLHPKACTSTFDCFPNVCCQEAGLRHCRPPKKSLLTWMANFLNVDFVKRLTQNIVIK